MKSDNNMNVHIVVNKTIKKFIHDFMHVKNNRIVFKSLPDYSDNARVLSDYLINNGYADKYEIIWLVDEPYKWKEKYKALPIKFYPYEKVKQSAFKSGIAMRAKYCFFTHFLFISKFKKMENQTLVRLWHGCGYKDAYMNESDNKRFRSDYSLVPGEFFIPVKAKYFQVPENEILALGYPRYDLLKNRSVKAHEYVNGLKGSDVKAIIWMPTFRKTIKNNHPEDSTWDDSFPLLHTAEDWESLDNVCEEKNICVIIKRHPLQKEFSNDLTVYKHIKYIDNSDFEKYDIQLYEILQYTDGLISDYSSIAVDYLLLDRQIGFVLDDFDIYKKARGFVFDDPKKYMPGEHIYKKDDLYDFVKNVADGSDDYIQNRLNVKKELHHERECYCQDLLDYFGITKDKK